jgi:hypothetical protein
MAAVEAARSHAALVATMVVLVVDQDDPTLPAYRGLFPTGAGGWISLVVLEPRDTGNLVKATNTMSMRIAAVDPTAIIGNLGDDHMIRTPGWDRQILEALSTPGIAYGDDGLQGERLPTAPFISAEIVTALGWYALPLCRHLFVDNAWRDLGVGAGVLRYLPDVAIEHMHPLAGKGEWDPGYEQANGPDSVERDKAAYHRWRKTRMDQDIARVRAAIA